MAEQVIGDKTEALGVPLGQAAPRTFPGLTPIAKQLSVLQSQVAQLEASKYELDQIRATLLLSFGASPVNRYRFTISDTGTTLDLLLTVLQWLTRPAYSPAMGSKKEES